MKSYPLVLALVLSCGIASAQTPLLHYTFDEASSGNGTALDTGASPAADGTFTGIDVTRISSTPFGGSIAALNLTSLANPDYVTAGDADKLDGLSQLTLTAWINLQADPAHGNRIMAKQLTSGNFDGFSFALNNPTAGTISSENFQLNLALGGSGFAFNTSGADLNASNKWVFVAVAYDGTLTADNLKFYSGSETSAVTQLGVSASVAVGALVANANEFRVGASSGGGTSAGQYIDDVRIYSATLDVAQLDSIRLESEPVKAIYAASAAGATGELYILDADTGEMVQDIGPLNDSVGTNYPMSGLAFHPTTGVLYGSTGNSDDNVAALLVTINPASGLVSIVGPFNAGPTNSSGKPSTMGDLAFDSAGNLYGVGTIGGPQLYSINIATGKATAIGGTGLTSTTGGGLAVSSSGVFYGTPTAARYGTYNTTTGAFTAITTTMVRPAGGGGYGALEFDQSGTLYGLNVGPGSPPPTHLVTIDPATGTVTDIGVSLNSLDAIAFKPTIPPSLAIALAVDQVTLRWPEVSGFLLEYKTNLTSGAWLENVATPTLDNGTNTLTLPVDTAATFFRLHKP